MLFLLSPFLVALLCSVRPVFLPVFAKQHNLRGSRRSCIPLPVCPLVPLCPCRWLVSVERSLSICEVVAYCVVVRVVRLFRLMCDTVAVSVVVTGNLVVVLFELVKSVAVSVFCDSR